jgi:hypothetical protein
MDLIFSEGTRIVPLLIGVLALVFVPFISKIAEWFVTLIHELGHGLIAIPFGGRIGGIHLESDGSGSANLEYVGGIFYKPVRMFSLLMGYAFPVYLGLVLLLTSYYNNVFLGACILGAIGVILLFSVRNLFAFFVVLAYEALFVLFFWTGMGTEITLSFILFVGFLFTLRGLIDIIMVGTIVFSDDTGDDYTDFHILEDEIFFNPKFWYVFFILSHGLTLTLFFIHFFPLTLSF